MQVSVKHFMKSSPSHEDKLVHSWLEIQCFFSTAPKLFHFYWVHSPISSVPTSSVPLTILTNPFHHCGALCPVFIAVQSCTFMSSLHFFYLLFFKSHYEQMVSLYECSLNLPWWCLLSTGQIVLLSKFLAWHWQPH